MLSQRIFRHSLGTLKSSSLKQGQFVPSLVRFAHTTDGQEKVYTGSLASRMKAVKVFSLTTSITGCVVQPTLLEQSMKIGGTAMAVAACGKYVTELYYNEKTGEYTAVTISLFLMRQE
uniref:Uncharacterized protein n=1 Tax=Megaselia scalaris TaxID=36166 RepID=T1H2H7_MEGSC